MSFYLTLPSNSSMTFHPENTLTHYFTQLPKTIQLDGEWEVGLAEIQFPHTWNNVTKPLGMMVTGEIYETHRLPDQVTAKDRYAIARRLSSIHNLPPPIYIEIPPGFYTLETMTEVVMRGLREAQEHAVKVYYNTPQKTVTIHVPENKTLYLDRELQSLWYIPTHVFQGTENSTHPIDLNQGLHGLYVYTNVVEHQVVGDVMVPLLRIVPIDHTLSGTTLSHSYQRIFYLSTNGKQFSSVEIDIKDDTGQSIPFQVGKVNVTLHFRKRKPSLF